MTEGGGHHPDRVADWLEGMLTAARQACSYVDGMSREEFLDDPRTQQAVAMNLVIIGEAAARALEQGGDTLTRYPDVPWASMKGMRNRIAHGYFELDFAVVWETVQRSLPDLVEKLPGIIASIHARQMR